MSQIDESLTEAQERRYSTVANWIILVMILRVATELVHEFVKLVRALKS